MSRLIIDASIVSKWVVPEPDSGQALALRRRHTFAAPELMVAECANVLWKQVQRGFITAEQAQIAAGLIARADIELLPMRPLMSRASELSLSLGHPAYDCFYLAAALAQDCAFITADERLVRRVAGAGGLPPVQSLAAVIL